MHAPAADHVHLASGRLVRTASTAHAACNRRAAPGLRLQFKAQRGKHRKELVHAHGARVGLQLGEAVLAQAKFCSWLLLTQLGALTHGPQDEADWAGD